MWSILAETTDPTGFGLDTIIQLVSAGGFGAMAWYLIGKVLPEKDREHRAERQADQERWREERGEFRAYIAARDAQWIDYLEKLDNREDERTKKFMELTIRLESAVIEAKRQKPNA